MKMYFGFKQILHDQKIGIGLLSFTLTEIWKRLMLLINCAGLMEPGEFSSLRENQFRKMIDTQFHFITYSEYKKR